jgi:hypothetical protein
MGSEAPRERAVKGVQGIHELGLAFQGGIQAIWIGSRAETGHGLRSRSVTVAVAVADPPVPRSEIPSSQRRAVVS